jgi:hypothetical protein
MDGVAEGSRWKTEFLKEKMMKKTWMILVPMLALGTALQGHAAEPGDPSGTAIDVANTITTGQSQNVQVSSSGGTADSQSGANAQVDIDTTSISDYEARTAPLTSFPPYLPNWMHGGWGTVKAYFPNGPTINDQIYETTFDPENPEDMRELRGVLKDLPHKGLAEAIGGVLNGVAVVVFGSPNKYHHGRGLEIINSVIRDRRPEGKPLLVFIDSHVDIGLLREEGYAYMGKVDVEGDVDRNWDQAYKAAVAEALLYDVDILLISGGMKGVTVGENVTFPSAAGGYSQVNYSLSLMGAKASGITEGKGKAVLSADAYRFYPGMVERRRIPESLYDRIRLRPRPALMEMPEEEEPVMEPASRWIPTEPVVVPTAVQQPQDPEGDLPAATACDENAEPVAETAPVACESLAPQVQAAPTVGTPRQPAARTSPARRYPNRGPGINVSRQLYEMAGFTRDQQVGSINLR